MAESAENTAPSADAPEPAGIEAARLPLRQAGYCVLCDRIVVRNADDSCSLNGCPPAAVSGRIMLDEDEECPTLPRFNLAAMLIPMIWGPAHGQWAGAFFLPIWLFMDSAVAAAMTGPWQLKVVATVVVLCTVGFGYYFARRANGLAWRRVCNRLSVREYVVQERVWAVVSVPAFAALLGWGVYYRLVLAG